MEAKNPFEGILTYGHYGRLWALSAAVILLQAGASLLALAAGRRWGFELNSFEAYIPALLATGLGLFAAIPSVGETDCVACAELSAASTVGGV